MSRHRCLESMLGVCVLLLSVSAAQSVVKLTGLGFKPRSGISIEIIGAYDNLPKAGYLPLRISIRNDSSGSHEWTFRFLSQSGYGSSIRHNYEWKASVAGRSEKRFDVVVPLVAMGNAAHTYPSLQVVVSGYGVRPGTAYYAANYKYSGNPHAPFTGLSHSLAVKSMGPLEQAMTNRSMEFTGCQFDIDYLSSDWRAYLGFGSVWLTELDWGKMSGAVRAGMLEWISQGGQLFFCTQRSLTDPALARLGLPPGTLATRRLGLGQVEIVFGDGTTLDPELAASEILKGKLQTHVYQLDEGYRGSWRLKRLVPESGINATLIVLAMIGFAVMVCPVNLVVFAGKRHRHRLFLTTPIISIVASLALVGVILIRDGVGGEGGRVALKLLMPDTHRELIIQEQVSLTGMLLASRFEIAETDYIAMLNLARPEDQNRTRHLVRTPTTAEGDWYSSRSVQGHCLSRITPSRSRIEWLNPKAVAAGAAAPILLSSLDQSLHDVILIDDQGAYWSAAALPVGVRTTLVKSTRSDFRRDWWEKQVVEPGLRAGGWVDRLAFQEGHVFGVVDRPHDAMIETHGGIDWDVEHMIVVGPVLVQEGT